MGRDVDSGPVSRADILVTRSQAYTGDSPWALQTLGCGHTGERVSLTQRFINTPRLRDGGDIRGESISFSDNLEIYICTQGGCC